MTNLWTQSFLPAAQLSVPVILFALMFMALVGTGLVADVLLVVFYVRRRPDWSECLRRLQSRFWTWREAGVIILVLAGLILMLAVCSHAARLLIPGSTAHNSPLTLIVQVILPQVAALTLMIVLARQRRLPLLQAFGGDAARIPREVGKGLFFYVAALPPLFLASFLYILVLMKLGYPMQKQEVVKWLIDPSIPAWFKGMLALFAVSVVPVAEEFFFRGVNMAALSKLVRPIPTVILTSLFFAGLHFQVTQLVPLFAIATAFSLAYLYTGSIVAPVTMHIAFNTMGILSSFLLRNVKDLPLAMLFGG